MSRSRCRVGYVAFDTGCRICGVPAGEPCADTEQRRNAKAPQPQPDPRDAEIARLRAALEAARRLLLDGRLLVYSPPEARQRWVDRVDEVVRYEPALATPTKPETP